MEMQENSTHTNTDTCSHHSFPSVELWQSDPAAQRPEVCTVSALRRQHTHTRIHSHIYTHISGCREAGGVKWPKMDSVSD